MTGEGYSYNDADLLFTVLAKFERRTKITLQEYPSEWVVCKKKNCNFEHRKYVSLWLSLSDRSTAIRSSAPRERVNRH